MPPPLDIWAGAFCLTQLVEIPIYLHAARSLPAARRWVFAAGASAITHPVVWFGFPWNLEPWLLLFLAAESFAILTEALWGRLLHVPRPFRWSLVANLSSVAAGFLARELWPSG